MMHGSHSFGSQPKGPKHPLIVNGIVETILPEVHHPIRIENDCECPPDDHIRVNDRTAVNDGTNLFTTLFTTPCPLYEKFKRLVSKKPQPCNQHTKVEQQPKAKQKFKADQQHKARQHKSNTCNQLNSQIQCPVAELHDRRLLLEIVIPEKYFNQQEASTPSKTSTANTSCDCKRGPLKDAVKKAVSDAHSKISGDSRGSSQHRVGGDRTYVRNRNCKCASVSKKSSQPLEKTKRFPCDRRSADPTEKPSLLIRKVSYDRDEGSDSSFVTEPKPMSSLAKKCKYFADEDARRAESNKLKDPFFDVPARSSCSLGKKSSCSLVKNSNCSLGKNSRNSEHLTGTSEGKGGDAVVKQVAKDLGEGELVTSVTNYEDEAEKRVEQEPLQQEIGAVDSQDKSANALQREPPVTSVVNAPAASTGDNSGDRTGDNVGDGTGKVAGDSAGVISKEISANSARVGAADNAGKNAGGKAGVTGKDSTAGNAGGNVGDTAANAVTRAYTSATNVATGLHTSATNAAARAYTSATSVFQEYTSGFEVNKPMLMAIIMLLLFVIGLLLLYLMNRGCVYKKAKIYRGNCHFFT